MKSGVIIINTSRGQFIDENALFDGLSTKKIQGHFLAHIRQISTAPAANSI